MEMTKEERLLIPRYKVIAPYPGMNYTMGDIVFTSERPYEGMSEMFFETYPHLFKKLAWYQERTKEELMEVKYVKRVGKYRAGAIHTVAAPEQDGRIWHVDNEIEFRFIKYFDFIPVSLEEYEQYITNKKQPNE